MAESESGQEKSEPATARRRQQAREEGQLPKSQEVNTVLLLIAGVVACYLYFGDYWDGLGEACRFYLRYCAEIPLSETSLPSLAMEVGLRTLYIMAPFFIIFLVVSVAANLFQVGFLFSTKPLEPKFSKIDPISGTKRLFSARGIIELIKSCGKIFLIAPIMIYLIYKDIPDLIGVGGLEINDGLIFIGHQALELAIYAILILIVLAIADYAYQRWQHEQDMRMTKEEIKQEMQDIQGDPHIKGRIRSIQREMARRRMMEKVPEADVVVTNPTEYAVALKYAPDENPAPQVLAKGKNLNAKRIKDLALEHHIPIVENRPLAQSLYKLVEVGGLIPPDLYQAVAEMLAYVYRMSGRKPKLARKAG